MKTCNDCVWFETTEYPHFCLVSDYYTKRNSDDKACDEFVPIEVLREYTGGANGD
jgi:hypothetical protein